MCGYAQYARLQSSWITPLSNGLSLKDSMIVGTAGFTAALSIQSLQQAGMNKSNQPTIAVTGATGGVGTMAIALLKAKGYDNIIAITSKDNQSPMLKSLGASDIVSPKDIIKADNKPLQSQCFHYVRLCGRCISREFIDTNILWRSDECMWKRKWDSSKHKYFALYLAWDTACGHRFCGISK